MFHRKKLRSRAIRRILLHPLPHLPFQKASAILWTVELDILFLYCAIFLRKEISIWLLFLVIFIKFCSCCNSQLLETELVAFIINLCLCIQYECICAGTESMEWFLEDQAFSRSYDLAPPPSPPPTPSLVSMFLFLSFRVCRRPSLLTGEGWRGWRRSQIIRRRENLVFYKSFKTEYVDRYKKKPCSFLTIIRRSAR
jgi:hypothetical protein